MAIIKKKKKIKENKCQQGYREKGTLEHHWCEWILIMAIMGNRMEFPEFEAFTDEMILDINHCCMEIFLAPGEKIKAGVHNTAAVWLNLPFFSEPT